MPTTRHASVRAPAPTNKSGLGPARARRVDDGVGDESEGPRLFQHLGKGLDIADSAQRLVHVARDHGAADGHDIGAVALCARSSRPISFRGPSCPRA